MDNDQATPAAKSAAAERAKYITAHFPNVPEEFAAVHIGLDPKDWAAQGEQMQNRINESLQLARDEADALDAANKRREIQERLEGAGLPAGIAAFAMESEDQIRAMQPESASTSVIQAGANDGALPEGLARFAREVDGSLAKAG
jgi:hypothetical protein